MRWLVEHVSGTVRRLHERSESLLYGAAPTRPVALVLHPVDDALVLGSTQADLVVDRTACADAGIDVVRRRSGGGAVLVQPGGLAWVDLFVPADDPLWQPDVGRAAWWLGETWAAALAAAGLGRAEVWKGEMLRRPWSAQVCFAGLAAGEVTLAGAELAAGAGAELAAGAGAEVAARAQMAARAEVAAGATLAAGAKVVGISQRRARSGALFQSACLASWEPGRLLGLMAMAPDERTAAADALAEVAVGVGPGASDALDHFLSALP